MRRYDVGGGAGRFIAPTVFSDVSADMSIARDEIFGPVLTVMPFDTVEEAIALANEGPSEIEFLSFERTDALYMNVCFCDSKSFRMVCNSSGVSKA